MTETSQLLHNMSAPPKSVVKYTGLSNAATTAGPGGTGVCGVRFTHDGVFGTFITFRLPEAFQRSRPKSILEHLGLKTGRAPEKTLLRLIKDRANEISLPDACVVVPTNNDHPCPWPDPLSALAVITKSSASIWLRSKTPRLSTLRNVSEVSLLLPPNFSDQIEELPK
jgi:hypothetical protein